MGSTDIFTDEYFDKEENQKIFVYYKNYSIWKDFLLKLFFTDEV
jgi:hypothetical protein